jgi:hypothetical protein
VCTRVSDAGAYTGMPAALATFGAGPGVRPNARITFLPGRFFTRPRTREVGEGGVCRHEVFLC